MRIVYNSNRTNASENSCLNLACIKFEGIIGGGSRWYKRNKILVLDFFLDFFFLHSDGAYELKFDIYVPLGKRSSF